MSQTIAVINFGYCNIGSITRVLSEVGANVIAAEDPAAMANADKIVLPGVGSFQAAMESLHRLKLVEPLRESVLGQKKPFLGICLGMQLMAESGLEGGEACEGLGLVAGRVEKMIPSNLGERIPHMGWNNVRYAGTPAIFDGIPESSDFYFVHSYKVVPDAHDAVIGMTDFAGGIAAAVAGPHERAWGVQFHPEKSQKLGMKLLENFVRC